MGCCWQRSSQPHVLLRRLHSAHFNLSVATRQYIQRKSSGSLSHLAVCERDNYSQLPSNHNTYTVFWAPCIDIFGRHSVSQQHSVYLNNIACNKAVVIQQCSAVVIAERTAHMTKLEASLQALYTGIDLPVVMMSETTRLAKHGLVVSSKSIKKLQDLKQSDGLQAQISVLPSSTH